MERRLRLAAQQGAAADEPQLVPIEPWYRLAPNSGAQLRATEALWLAAERRSVMRKSTPEYNETHDHAGG